MIKVHHLNNSRSQRILWALEELGLEYEIIQYQRDAETRLAPESLREIHPLGKSPVLEDGDVKIAESGAIIEYLIRTYGGGKFAPAADSAAYNKYVEWMHYAEGSAMLPLLLGLYTSLLGEAAAPLQPRIQSEFANHFGYMAQSLGEQQYFMGDELTGADFMLSFPMEAANSKGALGFFPNLDAYMKRIEAREAYKRALERGGPYKLGA
ncbi:glutathione S-transferase [Kordiimonas sp. SCSIO 12603]|uniref:glutathione S-transferase family protein n=1 Tax=Kordiimonas sp. SCSIO 12603 TaxID=2829596 RepID=UPI002104BC6F|nr:glutathione S-transferase [Kordiimonas sp. SCSIO 12603]UTW59574.1 glutathione S-transferase [Kordiimonas sp. SCSIO 12603]